MENKKAYIPPQMNVVEMETDSKLLCASSDNPYWSGCHDGWQGKWGEEE